MDDVVDKIYKAKIVSAKQNAANMAKVKANWNLGPEKTSPDMVSNKPYWSKMAKVWDIQSVTLGIRCAQTVNTSTTRLRL